MTAVWPPCCSRRRPPARTHDGMVVYNQDTRLRAHRLSLAPVARGMEALTAAARTALSLHAEIAPQLVDTFLHALKPASREREGIENPVRHL